MDFDSLFDKFTRFLSERDQLNRDLYKGAGAMEHFRAGVDFAHKQHRAQATTAVISVVVTVFTLVIVGVVALIIGGGFGQIAHGIGSLGGSPQG